jgi:hypothetical protein
VPPVLEIKHIAGIGRCLRSLAPEWFLHAFEVLRELKLGCLFSMAVLLFWRPRGGSPVGSREAGFQEEFVEPAGRAMVVDDFDEGVAALGAVAVLWHFLAEFSAGENPHLPVLEKLLGEP